MYAIQQNTASYPLLFLMVLSSDHISPATGLSPTVVIRKPGGAFASPAGAVSEIGNGWYQVAGNATDANTLGPLILHATAATADPSDPPPYQVVAYNPQDPVLGLTGLGVNLTKINGNANAAAQLSDSADVIFTGSVTGSPTATSFADTSLPGVDDQFWNGRIIIFTSGSLRFQATNITAFAFGTKTLTFTQLTRAPLVGDAYVII